MKLLEVGYKRTGDKQATRINNQNNASANVVTNGTMAEIYKSKWLRDKEAQLASQCEAEARSVRKLSDSGN